MSDGHLVDVFPREERDAKVAAPSHRASRTATSAGRCPRGRSPAPRDIHRACQTPQRSGGPGEWEQHKAATRQWPKNGAPGVSRIVGGASPERRVAREGMQPCFGSCSRLHVTSEHTVTGTSPTMRPLARFVAPSGVRSSAQSPSLTTMKRAPSTVRPNHRRCRPSPGAGRNRRSSRSRAVRSTGIGEGTRAMPEGCFRRRRHRLLRRPVEDGALCRRPGRAGGHRRRR